MQDYIYVTFLGIPVINPRNPRPQTNAVSPNSMLYAVSLVYVVYKSWR